MNAVNKAPIVALLSLAILLSGMAIGQSLPPLDPNAGGQTGAWPDDSSAETPPAAMPQDLQPDPAYDAPTQSLPPITGGDREVIEGYPPPIFADQPTAAPPAKPAPKTATRKNPTVKGQVQKTSPAQTYSETGAKPADKANTPTAKTQPTKPATKTTTTSSPKTKPVVHFPVNVLPREDETSSRAPRTVPPGPAEPGPASRAVMGPQSPKQSTKGPYYLYPRGYKAYLAPLNADQKKLHNDAIFHYNRANWFGRREQVDEAIAEYRQSIVLNPMFADAYVGLAAAHMQKNEWETVIEESRKALRMKTAFQDPANIVQGWYNLAAAYCVVDDYDMARTYYKLLKKAGHPATESLGIYIQRTCQPH